MVRLHRYRSSTIGCFCTSAPGKVYEASHTWRRVQQISAISAPSRPVGSSSSSSSSSSSKSIKPGMLQATCAATKLPASPPPRCNNAQRTHGELQMCASPFTPPTLPAPVVSMRMRAANRSVLMVKPPHAEEPPQPPHLWSACARVLQTAACSLSPQGAAARPIRLPPSQSAVRGGHGAGALLLLLLLLLCVGTGPFRPPATLKRHPRIPPDTHAHTHTLTCTHTHTHTGTHTQTHTRKRAPPPCSFPPARPSTRS